MAEAMMVTAVLIGLIGLVLASQATLGVAVVGFACLLAVAARMIQAAGHARSLRREITDSRTRLTD